MLKFQYGCVKFCNQHFELSSSLSIAKLLIYFEPEKFFMLKFQYGCVKFCNQHFELSSSLSIAKLLIYFEPEKFFMLNQVNKSGCFC